MEFATEVSIQPLCKSRGFFLFKDTKMNNITIATHVIALIIGFIVGMTLELKTDVIYASNQEKTDKFVQFCELNEMGTLKSYDYNSFTCNSGTEVDSDLVLGRE